jgi:hypothetical protein
MSVVYLHLAPNESPPPLQVAPFRAVLIADRAVTSSWRQAIAAWLVSSGCLYFVAWGAGCEAWHDDVDCANLETFDYGDIPDEHFVMTTWHEKDPLSEALWFAGQCASHPDVPLTETMLLHIADEPRETAILKAFKEAQAST